MQSQVLIFTKDCVQVRQVAIQESHLRHQRTIASKKKSMNTKIRIEAPTKWPFSTSPVKLGAKANFLANFNRMKAVKVGSSTLQDITTGIDYP
jgi:hypothetical protein